MVRTLLQSSLVIPLLLDLRQLFRQSLVEVPKPIQLDFLARLQLPSFVGLLVAAALIRDGASGIRHCVEPLFERLSRRSRDRDRTVVAHAVPFGCRGGGLSLSGNLATQGTPDTRGSSLFSPRDDPPGSKTLQDAAWRASDLRFRPRAAVRRTPVARGARLTPRRGS